MTYNTTACHHASLSRAPDATTRATPYEIAAAHSGAPLPARSTRPTKPYHVPHVPSAAVNRQTSPSTGVPRPAGGALRSPVAHIVAITAFAVAGIVSAANVQAQPAQSDAPSTPAPPAAQSWAPVVAWPDSYMSRVQVQALIQTIHAEILGSDSATLTLEKWCREHRLAGAAEPKVVAIRVRGADKPADADVRARLRAGAAEEIKYRRVRLTCGAQVLSEADNWYLPARLTDDMNRALEQTDTPFGKAILALQPFRRTYAARVLWSPLPPQWELLTRAPTVPPGPLALPAALFEHRAVVFGHDLRPVSVVAETYRSGLLAFPVPPQ